MENNYPLDDMDEEFRIALEEIGEVAAIYEASVVLTDHCLGCGNSEDYAFYNWSREQYNTVVLDFEEDSQKHLNLKTGNIIVFVCNNCRRRAISEDVLKRALIKMSMEGTMHLLGDE